MFIAIVAGFSLPNRVKANVEPLAVVTVNCFPSISSAPSLTELVDMDVVEFIEVAKSVYPLEFVST